MKRIFLHFYDIHFLKQSGLETGINDLIVRECDFATRFAILFADEVYLPAASFFESDICTHIVNKFFDLFQYGTIKIVGNNYNIHEFTEEKLSQYTKKSQQYRKYKDFIKNKPVVPPFARKPRSTSLYISNNWRGYLETDDIGRIIDSTGIILPKDFDNIWNDVPDSLDNKAFIPEYVIPILLKKRDNYTFNRRITDIINFQYFSSYTEELQAGVIKDLVYLASRFELPSHGPNLPYKKIIAGVRDLGLQEKIAGSSGLDLIKMKKSQVWIDAIAYFVKKKIILPIELSLEKDISKIMDSVNENYTPDKKINENFKLADIGIITALPEEFIAVCDIFEASDIITYPGRGGGRKYRFAEINDSGGSQHVIAIAMQIDMGNNNSSFHAAMMQSHCPNVEHILMVGIAGAVPNEERVEENVDLGDIVVSGRQGVVQYDMKKLESESEKNRHAPRPPSALFSEVANLLQAGEMNDERPWNDHIQKAIERRGAKWARPGGKEVCPKVHIGTIASANILLKDPGLREKIRDKFAVKAVEMEGSGIADVSWLGGIDYFVIRGTCDKCDSEKNDDWHKYASLIAAAYARTIIEHM